jgi:hypothetical protein
MATQASGKVSQIFVNDNLALFRLSDLPTTSKPRNSNFEIQKSDPNYNALYSLALSAAINRYTLRVTTKSTIKSTENAIVKQLWVNW